MSTITNRTPIFTSNTNENIVALNKKSYDDLIGYCALRKQFSRIIPSYYIEIQGQNDKNREQNISYSSLEEYKHLKEEINNIKKSIEILKESKQEKMKTIENLRNIMRKVGQKQISYKDIKQLNNNNNNNNYCTREKQHIDECTICSQRKGSSNFKGSSDEGLSMAPTISGLSGLSSGKDDDNNAEEGQKVSHSILNISNSSSDSWCFTNEENNRELLMLGNPEQRTAPLHNSN